MVVEIFLDDYYFQKLMTSVSFYSFYIKKKPPKNKKAPPSKIPTVTPIKAGLLLPKSVGAVGECVEVVGFIGADVDDGDEGEKSKLFVHINSSLLLISSNKISLSVD
jgi:hypothetical protein